MISKLVARRSLREAFDPALIITLATPVIVDIIEIFMAQTLPTITALVAGRFFDFGGPAPLGAQALVLYRYALAATLAAIASLYEVDPLKSWCAPPSFEQIKLPTNGPRLLPSFFAGSTTSIPP